MKPFSLFATRQEFSFLKGLPFMKYWQSKHII